MRGARLVRVAWLLAGLTLTLEVADTLMTASYRALFSEETIAVHGWPFNTFAVIGSSFMGALIVSRYPRHPVGWLLSAVGTGASISLTLEAYSIWVLDHDGPGSQRVGQVTGWLSLFSGGAYALTLLTVMMLIAPDGVLLSRRWRWAAAVSIGGYACILTGLLILPGLSAGDMVLDEGETGGAAVTGLFTVGLRLITVGLTASVVSAVIRMRRAQGVLHQQLRWILASGVFLPAGLIWRQVVQQANGGEQTWLATLPLLVAYCFIPICTAVAILHYRLYDIEVIINRAVVLAVGTAFVAVGYVALVVGLGGQVGSRTGGFWPSLLATAVVALAFQPLRNWVSHLADRAAYGSRAVPYEALSDFSQRLGDALAPQALLPAVAQAAGQVVSARRATASLVVPGGRALTASWPEGAGPGEVSFEVDVLDGGEALGAIAVTTPPGRNIRAGETRLLQDLADQASVAFRNASLDAEAEAHLAALNVRAEGLAASRRRIVEARDAECRRLEATIIQGRVPAARPPRGRRPPASGLGGGGTAAGRDRRAGRGGHHRAGRAAGAEPRRVPVAAGAGGHRPGHLVVPGQDQTFSLATDARRSRGSPLRGTGRGGCVLLLCRGRPALLVRRSGGDPSRGRRPRGPHRRDRPRRRGPATGERPGRGSGRVAAP